MTGNNPYNFPPAFTNLGYDNESGAGPSDPSIWGESSSPGVLQGILHPVAPPYPFQPSDGSNLGPPPTIYNPPSLVFEDIYDACVAYIKKHYGYGSRFINQMKLTEIVNKVAYHYKLESLGEKRAITERFKPYKGEPVDGPDVGPTPDPWEVAVDPPALFEDSETEKIIPHTDTVRLCFTCDGRGKVTCWGEQSCNGSGQVKCLTCKGTGTDDEDYKCDSCNGSGKVTCLRCNGGRKIWCHRCLGSGTLLHYQVLIVTWKNHINDFKSDTDSVPKELILKSGGVTLLDNQDVTVLPLQNVPDELVCTMSAYLVEEHLSCFTDEMIIRQRHVLRAFPLTKVKYNWKEKKEGEFYVYGTDRRVHFEVYPERWCTLF